MSEVEELKRIIEILDQEGVEKCEKLERQAKRIKELEKALDKAIKKITLDNDSGMEFLDAQYEHWKAWCMKDE